MFLSLLKSYMKQLFLFILFFYWLLQELRDGWRLPFHEDSSQSNMSTTKFLLFRNFLNTELLCIFPGRKKHFLGESSGKKNSKTVFPIPSMYGIFTYIFYRNPPNVGKYTQDGMGLISGWTAHHPMTTFPSGLVNEWQVSTPEESVWWIWWSFFHGNR